MKIDWAAMPWEQVEELAEVFDGGAKKHGLRGYDKLDAAAGPVYFSKAMRHISAGLRGELDPESGKSHYVHAAADLLILARLASGCAKSHLPSDHSPPDTSPTEAPDGDLNSGFPNDEGDNPPWSRSQVMRDFCEPISSTFVGPPPIFAKPAAKREDDHTED